MLLTMRVYLFVVFVCLFSGSLAGIGCPCVQDMVTFEFDLNIGCRGKIVNRKDFQDTSCTVHDASNSRIKKIIIHDHQGEMSVPVHLGFADGESSSQAPSYYYFQYNRSRTSPSVLFMDFLTASGSLSASVDLYYATSSRNCVVSDSPIFWPDDQLFFLKVVRTLNNSCTTDRRNRTNHLRAE